MKLIATFLAAVVLALPLQAQTQIKLPNAPSPRGTVSQRVGVTDITIDYGRPSVRNRDVWGSLVPYDQVWRAGANENTVFTVSTDVKINGKDLPAGSYGLHMIPTKGEWTVIFNKNYHAWGSYFYDEAEDVLRVKTKPGSAEFAEVLTYSFPAVTPSSATVQLHWEKMTVPITIDVDIYETVLADLKNQLSGLAGFNAQAYANAAGWVVNNNGDMALAKKWVQRAMQPTPTFQAYVIASTIAAKEGNEEEAQEHIAEAVKLANNQQLNMLGYQMLQQDQGEQAVKLFKINVDRHPEDPNVWDSLGEGYASIGENEKAIECFKKSLSMNPPALTKQNSEMWLDKLQ